MMETSTQEKKPNFLVGGDNGYDEAETEEKDVFPTNISNGSIPKQLSDAGLIDKRRRLR